MLSDTFTAPLTLPRHQLFGNRGDGSIIPNTVASCGSLRNQVI